MNLEFLFTMSSELAPLDVTPVVREKSASPVSGRPSEEILVEPSPKYQRLDDPSPPYSETETFANLTDQQLRDLVRLNDEYDEKVLPSILFVKRLSETKTQKDIVVDYTKETVPEKNGGGQYVSEMTKHRKVLYRFWENFVKLFKNDLNPRLLEDFWQYRAADYLRYSEILDAVNFKRWKLGEDKTPTETYWQNRPTSYEKLSEMLQKLGKRSADEDEKVREAFENTWAPLVTETLAEIEAS